MNLLFLGRITLASVGILALPQQPADTFEIAAIHPSHLDSMNTQIRPEPGGHLVVVNATLRTLIRNAYNVAPYQIVGEPRWSEVDHFDINAKNASGQDITQDSLRPLLESLLADRFHLQAHWETREQPILALVVDKDGPKFKPTATPTEHGMNTSRVPGRASARGSDVPITDLALEIGFRLQRSVADQTNLSGNYDFFLHWNPDTDTPAGDSTEPSLATALHEQLGLKLVPTRGPVQVLIIDKAEKPTEN